jgi:hypothetical protein
MVRWGYVVVSSEGIVRATTAATGLRRSGIRCLAKSRSVGGNTWATMRSILSRIEVELPDCLPILEYGPFSGP